uniref:Xylulose kinase-1 n=1 Tax=Tanacetum cinerariifolium TaxID=118510 RepID=A0A6L2NBZ3_TANCI|nr:xylulose kinase-1 [Tanacetum cinerariifolium]
MIAYLIKSDAIEGFNQIIDFLNGSSIKYALTVNPNIYVSCIKQFWITVAVKKVNDVTRLQALVDKKKVVVTKATIRDALRLDDADGVECLPNEEIFAELARICYEKPSTKLTFYKGKQVGNLSSHSTKYISHDLTQKVFANMRWVGKGFSGVDTPLFEGMLVAQEVGEDADEVHVEDVTTAGIGAEGAASDDVNVAINEPSIPSPIPPTPPPQPSQDIPTTITAADVLIPAAAPTLTTTPSRKRKEVVIRDPEETTTTSTIIHSEAKSKNKGKGILVEEPKPIKKQAQIEQDEKYARELKIITFTTTQLILLVEMRYPLIRFTLDQKLNNVRLEVEEESEVSLKLVRFIQQQHQEGAQLNFRVDAAEESQGKHAK